MSLLLSRAFGRILFAVPDVLWPSSSALGTWFVLSVVVAVLASGWPARRATQVSAAVALAYD